MAATVIINRLTGAGPTKTDITAANTRASSSDDPSPGATNPIAVPSSGTNYSFWVVTRLEVTVTPDGTVDNIRWHPTGSSSWGTGIGCVVNTATGYVQASGTVGTTGTQLTTGNYGTLAGAPVSIFTYNEGSPLAVTGTMSNPTTGDFGDYVVWQATVASTAGAGTQSQETARFRFDET